MDGDDDDEPIILERTDILPPEPSQKDDKTEPEEHEDEDEEEFEAIVVTDGQELVNVKESQQANVEDEVPDPIEPSVVNEGNAITSEARVLQGWSVLLVL